MPLPSPWRASGLMVGLGVACGLAIVALLWLEYGVVLAAIPAALVPVTLLGGAELQAALRLNWSLREFASQVPGMPEASTSLRGDQRVHWPDLDLAASGGTHRFRIQGLTVDVDEISRSASTRRPREAAREALDTLGHDPSFESFDDRLPSVHPRLSAVRVAVPTAVAAFLLAAVVHPRLPARVLLAGLVATIVLTVALRWTGLARVRRALVDLADGLREGGVEVDRIDFVGGIVAPAFAVRTAEGVVAVRCVAHPWGRIQATVGDRSLDGRLPAARSVGHEAAALLREGAGGETRVDSGGLVTTSRVFSAVFGACFVAFGALLVLRPGVVTSGECTRACLLEWLLVTVPLFNVVFGGLLVLLGLASLALAAGRLRVPGR